jgi:acyl-CoA reductase-like NAD-dependent aldehyde dehydrogenase
MKFKGTILVRADNEDEAMQLFDDAQYGLATLFDNTDEMEVYAFQYDINSMREIYE